MVGPTAADGQMVEKGVYSEVQAGDAPRTGKDDCRTVKGGAESRCLRESWAIARSFHLSFGIE
ncbi:hypothetical protein D3C85_1883070 [compost metagenome]